MSIVMKNNFKSSNNPNQTERKFYKVYIAMIARCNGKTLKDRKWYFDKGITVCNRWKKFDNFFLDMWTEYINHLKKSKSTELDRINNNKGYSPKNCRWTTREENMNNTGNVRKIKGKTLTEWSKILGVDRGTLARRCDQGWNDDQIINHPFRKHLKIITG